MSKQQEQETEVVEVLGYKVKFIKTMGGFAASWWEPVKDRKRSVFVIREDDGWAVYRRGEHWATYSANDTKEWAVSQFMVSS